MLKEVYIALVRKQFQIIKKLILSIPLIEMWNQDDDDKKRSNERLSSKKGASYTQAIQAKKGQDKLKENRDQQMQDLHRRMDENLIKMGNFGKINDSNIDEYFRQYNEGISEQEIEDVLKIKAARLLSLWDKTVQELEKLEDIFARVRTIHTANSLRALTYQQGQAYAYEIGVFSWIQTFIGSVGLCMGNLEAENSDDRDLAIVSSSSRQKRLADYLKMVNGLNLDLDTKLLQELSDNLRLVLGNMDDF